jgi:hypothetical protein
VPQPRPRRVGARGASHSAAGDDAILLVAERELHGVRVAAGAVLVGVVVDHFRIALIEVEALGYREGQLAGLDGQQLTLARTVGSSAWRAE